MNEMKLSNHGPAVGNTIDAKIGFTRSQNFRKSNITLPYTAFNSGLCNLLRCRNVILFTTRDIWRHLAVVCDA